MFGFGKNKNIIKVTFYDGESDTPFMESKMPIEQLPDTFEVDTTMHLGDDDWIVKAAAPAEKSEFRKHGKLKLYLTKSNATQVDPNELLYSLPTINDDAANMENTTSLENVVVLKEDDWRQFEFIDKENDVVINEEFEAISNIYENHRVGVGFKKLHLRNTIAVPLNNIALTVDSLDTAFDIAHIYSGVAFNNAAATIVDGFAVQTQSSWLFWGHTNEVGQIITLNISPTEGASIVDIASEIDVFTAKYGLYLVDWPRLFLCGPGKLKCGEYTG